MCCSFGKYLDYFTILGYFWDWDIVADIWQPRFHILICTKTHSYRVVHRHEPSEMSLSADSVGKCVRQAVIHR